MDERQLRTGLEGATIHAADGTVVGIVQAIDVDSSSSSLRLSVRDANQSTVRVWIIDDEPPASNPTGNDLVDWVEDIYGQGYGRWVDPEDDSYGAIPGVGQATPPGPGDPDLDL